MLVTETEEFEKTQAVQSKLKRSIGNVLPTSSGGNNLSLISGNPFSYSQLGSLGTNLINDALSKSKIKLDKFQTNDMFRASLEQQQRKLIEEAKQSLAAQIQNAIKRSLSPDKNY